MKRIAAVFSLALAMAAPAAAQQVGDTVPESALRGPTYSLPPNGQQPPYGQQAPAMHAPIPLAPAPQAPAAANPVPPVAHLGGMRPGDDVFAAYVTALQRALPPHGYAAGPATGRLDHASERAILDYQRDAGLPQDAHGIGSLKQTLDHVTFARPAVMRGDHPQPAPAPAADTASPPETTPETAAAPAGGTTDPDTVRAVQQALKDKGYDIEVSGTLDVYTLNAIKVFQASNGLPRDGRIDKYLLDLLKK